MLLPIYSFHLSNMNKRLITNRYVKCVIWGKNANDSLVTFSEIFGSAYILNNCERFQMEKK